MNFSNTLLAVFLLLDFLALYGTARSLGGNAKSASSSSSGTTVHVHKLSAIGDVTVVKSESNLQSKDYVSMGLMPRHHNTRALMQFEPIPESCKFVSKAEIFVHYYRAYFWDIRYYRRFEFTPMAIQVRQILAEWNETETTWENRLAGQTWNKPGLELNDTDAAKQAEELTQTVCERTEPGYLRFDITSVAQRWTAGDDDHGVLLTLVNEKSYGRQIHLFSREAEKQDGLDVKPYLKLTCWSDFCAPVAQRRGGKAAMLEEEAAAEEDSTQEQEVGRSKSDKQISSGGSSFTLQANSYNH